MSESRGTRGNSFLPLEMGREEQLDVCPLSLGQCSANIKNYLRMKFYKYFTRGRSRLPGLATRQAAFLSLRPVAGVITVTSIVSERKRSTC